MNRSSLSVDLVINGFSELVWRWQDRFSSAVFWNPDFDASAPFPRFGIVCVAGTERGVPPCTSP
jgi:hypothetical protein